MKTIKNHTFFTLEVKQSKFIAHLFEYDQFDTILKNLKIEHQKARHFVNAFRYLNEFDQIVEGFSDDGEPRGTSGKPTLNVLQGADLINVGMIIVRYFGGTKLGTGGLVRAYSDSVNLAIEQAQLFEYKKMATFNISTSYSNISKIEYEISKTDIVIKEKMFEQDCVIFKLSSTKESFELFYESVKRLVNVID